MDSSQPGTATKAKPDYASVMSQAKSMPIAVVGMGFRGPGDATDLHGLWRMVLEGRESFGPIPEKRWNNAAFYHPDHARHGTVGLRVVDNSALVTILSILTQ